MLEWACLDEIERTRAITYIKENLSLNFMSTYVKFKVKTMPFRDSFYSSETLCSLSDAEWRIGFAAINFNIIITTSLNEVIGLMTAAASSSGIEHISSRFKLVHTKLRNQLGVKKAAKLVSVCQSIDSKM